MGEVRGTFAKKRPPTVARRTARLRRWAPILSWPVSPGRMRTARSAPGPFKFTRGPAETESHRVNRRLGFLERGAGPFYRRHRLDDLQGHGGTRKPSVYVAGRWICLHSHIHDPPTRETGHKAPRAPAICEVAPDGPRQPHFA